MNLGKHKLTIGLLTALGLLGAAFVRFGVWVHEMMPVPLWTDFDTEIYSFDYLGFANCLSRYELIAHGRFRHPLFHWLTAPITLFGHRVQCAIGENGYWIYLAVVFTAVVIGCLALMYRALRRVVGLTVGEAFACTALFASFAHVWLFTGLPETYPFALLLALCLVNWMDVRLPDRKLELAGWGAMALLTGGITLTQGVKVGLAYCVTKRPTKRQLMFGAIGITSLVALVIAIFYIRLLVRTHLDPSARGMDGAIHELFAPITGWSMSPGEWLHRACVFFSEPIIVRGAPFEVRTIDIGYDSWLQPALLALLYALSLAGAWIGRHHPLAKVLGAMFLVDIVLHFVIGWGLSEAQLYGAHWFYSIPLCAGLLLANAKSKRQWLTATILLLAVAITACNLHGYFCHPVGFTWPQ